MGTKMYSLLDGDGDETKVWYLLKYTDVDEFFYGNVYEIAKSHVPLSSLIPSYKYIDLKDLKPTS